jgi:hypothetical protein
MDLTPEHTQQGSAGRASAAKVGGFVPALPRAAVDAAQPPVAKTTMPTRLARCAVAATVVAAVRRNAATTREVAGRSP